MTTGLLAEKYRVAEEETVLMAQKKSDAEYKLVQFRLSVFKV